MKNLIFCFFFLTHCLLTGNIFAAENNKVSQQVYKKLQQSDKLVAKKSYDQALQVLQKALSIAENDYEKATVLRSQASVHAIHGHYKMAAELLSQSVELQALNPQQQKLAIYDLGQLYMAGGQYRKAIATLQPWLQKNRAQDVEVYVMMANAHTQLQQYKQALPYIKTAIKQSNPPKESWLQLNLALYYQLQQYQPAAQLLKRLLASHPQNKQYWEQLSSVYQQQQNYKKAASVKHLAYQKGILQGEKAVLDLVNLFLYIDAPYRAALLLQQAIKSGTVKSNAANEELLATAWTSAKEYQHAVKALEKASKLSDKGLLYLKLGQIYVEQEDWQSAIASLKKAMRKGGLKKPGNAYILLGISQFEAKKLADARSTFHSALKYHGVKTTARQWLQFIEKSNG